ncbi:arginine--tRNA ligase [Blochmannia endosymbiont of Camponotus (Colobopsis) obliquus]|uniref:arginine--tRNA ligase n=1 Tax=Blochmannia endosymbiont of Camponotus (Colobopsis) obliquus TaxID=1505597 RepID=UPI00061A70C2|nr:arginine--tRNA ligase [Blochmannia endosymbiont of Camponotus (Colobopsis) obliquus]AKC60608.1 arginine--tRNA ligase [Blochmannia endosymbiont of Camponotus (Colobopsis) obliquus]
MNIQLFLIKKIKQTFIYAHIPIKYNANVQQSAKQKFGDYQINGIMAIAKQLNTHPYKLATKIANLLKLNDIAYKIEIAKPGFINIFLKPKWIAQQINEILSTSKLGISSVIPQTIIIDYSSPNMAKKMHIGHLRSTIIGDSTARTLSFLGHNIIRVNHIGDWGTQFGMIIAYIKQKKYNNNIYQEINIDKLEEFYTKAKAKYDKDLCFAKTARNYVVKLQNGDKNIREIWKKIIDVTLQENQKIYKRLNVTLTNDHIMGESAYHNMIPKIITDLKNKKLATINSGATVVYLDNLKNKKGKKMGVIIQKKDGSYLYTTTDLACVKYRSETLKADRIIYYIDYRQHQHLNQVWNIAQKAGYIHTHVSLEYHAFGMILDKNKQPFKTRSGKTIKLTELLDEGFKRAQNLISNKKLNMNSTNSKKLAHIISIGAIKYADLSKNRLTDYIFDWNKMLNFEGNTAPYIQYAFTRITSILENSKENKKCLIKEIELKNKQEILLALYILRFEETIITVAKKGIPHILCDYLYKLATIFSSFYECCPILKIKDKTIRHSRLQLSILTAKILKQGLNLLGIEITEKM